MFETDVFVKFKFRFIGMPIFITNKAQIVLTYHTQKGHILIPGALKWVFWRYLTSNARPWLILLQYINCLDNLCTFSTFLLVRILDTQRAQTGLISNSWDRFLRTYSLWNSTFFGNSTNCLSPFTVYNVILTALSSQK
jgi:hypothetical protein